MFISTIIPTIGRTELAQAVQSVLDQTLDNDSSLEVIIVNDTGEPLPHASWQIDPRVQCVTINRHRQAIGRNVGAAMAKGDYLHFLDDDDWMLPGAFQAFQAAVQQSAAPIIYGAAQLSYDRDDPLIDQPSEAVDLGRSGNCSVQLMAGEWTPMGSFIVRRELFFALNGYDPRAMPGDDIHFGRTVSLQHDHTQIDNVVVRLERGAHSSTDYTVALERSREMREQLLDRHGAWRRLADSAETTYWRSRLLRIYLVSIAWSLKQRQVVRALRRMPLLLRSLLFALCDWHKPTFWRGLTQPHASQTRRIQ